MKCLYVLLTLIALFTASKLYAQDTSYVTVNGVTLISVYTYSAEEGSKVHLSRKEPSTELIRIDNPQTAHQIMNDEFLFVPSSEADFKKIFGEPNYDGNGYAFEPHLFSAEKVYSGCWLAYRSRNGVIREVYIMCH